MFEKGKEDIIEYCFRFMISKDMRLLFLDEHNIIISTKSLSAQKAAALLRNKKEFTITLDQVRDFSRRNWNPTNIKQHIKSLTSGLLKGHNWHGAMPSFLHLSFQNKVREYCAGKISLKEYIEIGTDIARQEFYIVVTHDLCESQVTLSFSDAIPSIANRSVSDFIFKEMPYDLKNSGIPNGWTLKEARKDPLKFAKSLYEGADKERLRKQAEKSINDWGLNRFYVIVDDLEQWINDPEKLLDKIIKECKKLDKPLRFHIDGLTILCHIVFID